MFARSHLLPAGLCFLLALSLILLPGCAGRKKKQSKVDAAPTVTAKNSDEVAAEKAESADREVPSDDQGSMGAPAEAAPEETQPAEAPTEAPDSTRGRAFDETAAPPPAEEPPPAYDAAPAPEEEPPAPAPVRRPRAKRRAAHAAPAPAAEESTGAEAAAPAGGSEYVVVKGDTIAKIARTHGVTPRKLMDSNNITDPRKLKVGQKLVIP